MRLRIDAHAQYEIRVYGEAMAAIVKAAVPLAYEAFEDYIVNSQKFSAQELHVIKSLLSSVPTEEELVANGLSGREAREFIDKLSRL